MADTVVSPEAQPLRVDVTLDEIEKGVKDADEANKKAAEAAAAEDARKKAAASAGEDPTVKSLREALRLSEESRLRTESQLRTPTAPAAPVVPEVKELTDEELTELHEKSPIAAIKYMQERAVALVEKNLSARLMPLVTGSASSLEEAMKSKYPDEFKLFGTEIQEFVSKADKGVFSTPKNWEDLIAYVRGRNVEKLIEHRMEKQRATDTANAQATQIASAGAHVQSVTRTPAPQGGAVFDDTTKAIIKELAASGVLDTADPEADYRKWLVTGRA